MKTDTVYLLERWHAGDRESLDRLLERHLPWIRDRVHHRLGDLLRRRGETGDYVQEAMVEVLNYTPRFRVSNEAQFRALLARIIENTLRDQHEWYTARRRDIARDRPFKPDTVLDLDGDLERTPKTPSNVVDQEEREAWVRLGIELLEPRDREVIVLRQWESLSFPEIGTRLGLDRSAAHKRFSRAIERLGKIVWAMRQGHVDVVLGADAPGVPA